MTKRLTDEALLPCPFCGGEATFEEIKHGDVSNWTVGCEDADGECYGYQSLTSFARKIEAARAWNRRATPADDLRAAIGPRAAYMTCRGCPAHRKTDWSDPSGDGETMDRGIVNNCGAADGRCIDGSYGSISPMPPEWCPAALSQNGGAE